MKGRLIPSQAECRRCERLFCYFRVGSHRAYCSVCIGLDRIDHIEFLRAQRYAHRVYAAWEQARRREAV